MGQTKVMLKKDVKTKLIKEHAIHEKDTGSSFHFSFPGSHLLFEQMASKFYCPTTITGAVGYIHFCGTGIGFHLYLSAGNNNCQALSFGKLIM